MRIKLTTILIHHTQRGPKFLSEVLRKSERIGAELEIAERDWLIACDRWPADPARRADQVNAQTKPCC